MKAEIKIGYTLSQVALAVRCKRSSGWVRKQGDFVLRSTGVSSETETWARMEYSSKRCAGYKLVKANAHNNI